MTDSLMIIKVPYVDNIFVNYIHAAFKGLTGEVLTGSETMPIPYPCKGTRRNILDTVGQTYVTHDIAQP